MAFSQSIGLLHLSLLGGLGGIVLLVNVASSERPLRSLDRDLFSWLRSDHPDLLRNLDWSSPLWRPWLNLKAMDLSGQDMRGLRMTGNTLRDLNLKGSHLENAELTCVTMHNVDLAGAHLHEAKFDYRNCSSSSQPASGNSPKGGPISAEMKVNLNGADRRHGSRSGQLHEPAADRRQSQRGKLQWRHPAMRYAEEYNSYPQSCPSCDDFLA
jgi:Pentapeptide repeats (8 copies)